MKHNMAEWLVDFYQQVAAGGVMQYHGGDHSAGPTMQSVKEHWSIKPKVDPSTCYHNLKWVGDVDSHPYDCTICNATIYHDDVEEFTAKLVREIADLKAQNKRTEPMFVALTDAFVGISSLENVYDNNRKAFPIGDVMAEYNRITTMSRNNSEALGVSDV